MISVAISQPRRRERKGPAPLQILSCTKCGEIKLRAYFYTRSKNGQVIQPCRECAKAHRRTVSPDVKRRYRERYAVKNAEYRRKYTARPEYKARRNALIKQRKATDPAFAIARVLRRTLARKLRRSLTTKTANTMDLLGCSIAEFLSHLERQFLPGMTWSNWGRGANRWQIDHKRPIASFDLTDPDQQRICFHFSNTQPLWAIDNLRKHAKISISGLSNIRPDFDRESRGRRGSGLLATNTDSRAGNPIPLRSLSAPYAPPGAPREADETGADRVAAVRAG